MRLRGAAGGGWTVCQVTRAPGSARPSRRLRVVLVGLTAVCVVTASCSAADHQAVVDPRPTPAGDVAEPSSGPAGDPSGAGGGTYLIECVEENLTQEPTGFTLTCGDANEALDTMRWQGWGSPRATAAGVLLRNTCVPSCAAGTLERFQVSVAASQPVEHGTGRVYTVLTVWFLGRPPGGYQRVERYPLPS